MSRKDIKAAYEQAEKEAIKIILAEEGGEEKLHEIYEKFTHDDWQRKLAIFGLAGVNVFGVVGLVGLGAVAIADIVIPGNITIPCACALGGAMMADAATAVIGAYKSSKATPEDAKAVCDILKTAADSSSKVTETVSKVTKAFTGKKDK